MHDIAIIGTGIAGLHLALQLQRGGLHPTLYVTEPPERMRAGRLRNTVTLLGAALDRMRELGVHHWDDPAVQIGVFDFSIAGHDEMSFAAPLARPAQFIDLRLSLPQLLEDFIARGGRTVMSQPFDPGRVADLASQHDLVVVASGGSSLAGMFPTVTEQSPFREPQRRVMAGLFRGIRLPEPFRFSARIIPGVGEIAEFQILTFGDEGPRPVNGILLEAAPQGPLEPITRLRYDDGGEFDGAMLEILREHHPRVFERIDDPTKFGLLTPNDVVQGAVLPVVRRGVVECSPGRFALALGDAHVTHDPIIGQGANAASRASWFLGELLLKRALAGGPLDHDFCIGAEKLMWDLLEPATLWCNAALMPPPVHALQLFAAASMHPSLAREYVANTDDPATMWSILSDPKETAVFIQRHVG